MPSASSGAMVRVVGGFSLLTVILTYPQIRQMASHVGTHYDTYFSIWRLAWIAHQLRHDPAHLFDANIFYPATGTLAYSDAILLPGLLAAPPIWLGIHPIVVYNVLILASFVACGTAMYLLAQALTGSEAAGWFAGAIFAFQPFRFGHYAQLEILLAWPIPLALLALHRVVATRRWQSGAWLGGAVAAQAWSCLYYAFFLVVALFLVGPVLAWRDRARGLTPLAAPLATAALVCFALTAAYARPYLAAERTVSGRTGADVREWSPTFVNYLATPNTSWLYGRLTGRFGDLERIMFPGVVALIMTLVALRRPSRGSRAGYVLLLIVAVDLSLGVHGIGYMTLYRAVPLFRALRVPARMFVLVSAAVAVLAAEGFATVLSAVRPTHARRAAAGALTGLVLLESAAMPLDLRAIAAKPANVYNVLKQQPAGVVMEWPLPRASSLGVTHEPYYMYNSIFHWARLVNGYSGFYPPSYIELVETVAGFPSPDSVAYLRHIPVTYVVLHGAFDLEHYRDMRGALLGRPDFELLYRGIEGVAEVTLFRLRAVSECRPAAPTEVRSRVDGRRVTIDWEPVTDAHRVEIGSKPGQSDILTATIERSKTSWRMTDVTPGSFYVRMRAINVCGDSDPSAELTVRVP